MKTLAAIASLACVVSALLVADFPAAEAGSGVDCSQVILSLADCLAFVSDGSTLEKPAASCCNGLKTVLKASPDCLCEALRNSGQFGVKLNVSKALTLPAACNLKAPPTPCELAPAPKAASPVAPAPHAAAPPAHAPKSASAPEPAAAPRSPSAPAPKEVSAPSPSSDSGDVPAPTPEKSRSAVISSSVSLVTAALGLFVASL